MPTELISRRVFLTGSSVWSLARGQAARNASFSRTSFKDSPVLTTLESCAGYVRKGPVLSVEWAPPEANVDVPLFSGTIETSTMESVLSQLLPFDESIKAQARHDGAIINIASIDRDPSYQDLLSLPVAPRHFSGKNWNYFIVDDYVRSCAELRTWVQEFHRIARRKAGVVDPTVASYGSGLGGVSPYIVPEYNIELVGKTLRDQLDEIALYTASSSEQPRDNTAMNSQAGWIIAITPPFRFDKLQQKEVIVRAFPGGNVPLNYFSTRSQRIKRR